MNLFEKYRRKLNKIKEILIKWIIFSIASILFLIDVITLPFSLIWSKPWLKWPLIWSKRSKQDPKYSLQLVRKAVRGVPKHFLQDCCTIDDAFYRAYQNYGPNRLCLAYREILDQENNPNQNPPIRYKLGPYKWITWKELMHTIDRFGHGLERSINLGKNNVRIIIFAPTSYQWFVAAQSIIKNGSVLVTLYPTLGNQGILEAIKEIEEHTICTTILLLEKLIEHPQKEEIFSLLKNIILLDCLDDFDKIDLKLEEKFKSSKIEIDSLKFFTFKQIIENGSNVITDFENCQQEYSSKNKPEQVAIIMYTSGSGGKPKGVLMSHDNLIKGFQCNLSSIQYFLPEAERHIYIGYLPLAHILEFCMEIMLLLVGARIGYSSPHTLTDISPGLMPGTEGDASLLKPTAMAAVPLVLDRIKKAVCARLNQKGLFMRKFFELLVEYKTFWISIGFHTPLLDRIFFNKFNELIGGRMEAMLVGGAPLSPETQKWIKACFKVILFQGYGATEMVAGGLIMDENDQTLAKVGGPLYGTKVKLVDWPEGGYTIIDSPNPRGEIHLSSQSTSIGYFRLDHLNHQAFYYENGEKWFKTGDIGEMFPNGSFKIIDRKKDFIKLQMGEYVSLGKIETKLKTSYLVQQICVCGDSTRTYLVAIVIPNRKALDRIVRLNSIVENERTKAIVEKVFKRKMFEHARRHGLRGYEIPRHYILVDDEWTSENDLVTASFKLKRKQIENFYREKIQNILLDE